MSAAPVPQSNGRRVVVTGFGAVTPLGNDVETFWRRLVAGESGVRRIEAFDPERVTSKVAGEVRDFDPSTVLDRKEIRRNDRTTQLALVAAREAMDSAGLPARLEGTAAEETGVLIGSGLGGSGTLIDQMGIAATRGPERLSPFFIPMSIANMPAGQVAMSFGPQGPNFAPVSACATGGHAIGEATEMILRGDAEMMLAGGTEAVVYEAIVGAFAAMRALSTRNDDPAGASRPFDRGRDGFVIAEGSAILVLEELDHARRRGMPILAEVIGYAASADAYHITLPSPGGAGAARAGRRALQKAGLAPQAVDLVCAHATSTPEGDSTELQGIRALLGDAANDVAITATKGSIGHTLGAAGAIAAVVAIKAMHEGCVPPTLNLVDPDPEVGELDCTPLAARPRSVDVAIVNAFGFGGQNASLILRRWKA
ncbi:MAG: 3-oxoacyl-[acyl-carrier-protein] synthase [Chloroflexota bacterium]|jgi:3-oxoacyl-[acyl-carrier-protein] synthase II|nr:3-oxoacyl-[acyl-carrier-protein] synthase [Chloroflexota bacterium]